MPAPHPIGASCRILKSPTTGKFYTGLITAMDISGDLLVRWWETGDKASRAGSSLLHEDWLRPEEVQVFEPA